MARTVFEITGTEAESFLQGLITNDINKMGNGLLYAALLTPQGKFIADFFLFRHGEAICLDADSRQGDDLLKRLTMYKLRADVAIAPSHLKVFRGTGAAPEGALEDPRHPALGWRLYGAEEGTDGTDFDAIRVEHCIPESGAELSGDTFILEAGFERLHGVDFRKGCYVGQEVTARMKHKTELRKGFGIVQVEGVADAGTEITAGGKPAGKLFTRSGDKAIAYLRFDRAEGQMQAGDATLHRL